MCQPVVHYWNFKCRPRALPQTARQPEDTFYIVVHSDAVALFDGAIIDGTQREGKTDDDG